MFSGPRVRISPSSAIVTSWPGTGWPTVPSLKLSRVLAVNAPVVSVIPYTSRMRSPRPAKNSPTSGGSGAAALTVISQPPSPSSDRIGRSTLSSAAANSAASAASVVCPYWQLRTYRRPASMAAAVAARRPSSASAASRACSPAWIFSQTRGTPKNAVGFTSATVPTSWVAAS